jgi:hypothetical protein
MMIFVNVTENLSWIKGFFCSVQDQWDVIQTSAATEASNLYFSYYLSVIQQRVYFTKPITCHHNWKSYCAYVLGDNFTLIELYRIYLLA